MTGVGHIGEVQRARAVRVDLQIISEQPAAQHRAITGRKQRAIDRLGSEHLSLDDEHVQIAVVVIIEQRHAWRHDLRVVELARHAVEVREHQPGLRSDVSKPGRVGRTAGRLRRPIATAIAASANEHGQQAQCGCGGNESRASIQSSGHPTALQKGSRS